MKEGVMFKIGDRVVLTSDNPDSSRWGRAGDIGIITAIDPDAFETEEICVAIAGDDSWWQPRRILELIDERPSLDALAMALELADLVERTDYDFRYDAMVAQWLRSEVVKALYQEAK